MNNLTGLRFDVKIEVKLMSLIIYNMDNYGVIFAADIL